MMMAMITKQYLYSVLYNMYKADSKMTAVRTIIMIKAIAVIVIMMVMMLMYNSNKTTIKATPATTPTTTGTSLSQQF